MEENNTNQELNNNEVKKHVCFENHCWKKCLAMLCASFLGGFLAFYFVADQMMHRQPMPPHFNPHHFEKRMFDDAERMYNNHRHDMDKMYKEDMKAFKEAFKINKNFEKKMMADMGMPMLMMDSVKIKTEFEDNKFNVIVCLKPFQNDESKVNYNVNGRKLTVFGNSQVKNKEFEQDVSFSQDFILPENADTAKISKVKDGHKLIISVPIKEK